MSDEEEEKEQVIIIKQQKGPIDLSGEPLLDLPIDTNSLISEPLLSNKSTIKQDILLFQ